MQNLKKLSWIASLTVLIACILVTFRPVFFDDNVIQANSEETNQYVVMTLSQTQPNSKINYKKLDYSNKVDAKLNLDNNQDYASEVLLFEDNVVPLAGGNKTDAAKIIEINNLIEKETEVVIEEKIKTNIQWKDVPYDSDLYWLSKLIHAEAEGEPYDGKIAVGNVVLNRVKDSHFKNSVKSVIFQKNQFSVVGGRLNLNPNQDSINAAYDVLYNGVVYNNMPDNVLYFNTFGKWPWARNIKVWEKIGGHYFGIQNFG